MAGQLKIYDGIEQSENFYKMLSDAQRDLDRAKIEAFRVRLILLLSGHIREIGVLRSALEIARADALGKTDAAAGMMNEP